MAQSAYELQRQILQQYGLPDAADVVAVINEGALNNDPIDLIASRLQDTATWKQRFAGNETLRQKGLNTLSVAEYLSQENQYKAILRNAGLPIGFHDDPSDFANLIGGSVSVAELQDRVNIASDIIHREDSAVLDQLAARGVSKDLLLAHALDPERAAPLIKKQQNSILIGAAGQRAGINTTAAQADRLAEMGIAEQQAIQGFGQIGDFLDNTEKAGEIYGESYSEADAIGEVFEGGPNFKRKRIQGTEAADFGGSSGYGVARRETSGSY